IVGILTVEKRRVAVQMFKAERVVGNLVDDNTWDTIVIARRQQGFHDSITFPGRDDHILTLWALLPRRVGTVTAIGKELEPIHQLRRKIVAEKREVILGAAYLKEFLPSGQWHLPRCILLVPALLNINQNGIAQIIRI